MTDPSFPDVAVVVAGGWDTGTASVDGVVADDVDAVPGSVGDAGVDESVIQPYYSWW